MFHNLKILQFNDTKPNQHQQACGQAKKKETKVQTDTATSQTKGTTNPLKKLEKLFHLLIHSSHTNNNNVVWINIVTKLKTKKVWAENVNNKMRGNG